MMRNFLLYVLLTVATSAFCASVKETVTDADGTIYSTIKIGNQVWAVENLKTTRFNDDAPLPLIADQSKWSEFDVDKKAAYCWYNNDTAYKKIYGALYNWYAITTGKLAPRGWHVATDADWTALEGYLIANGHNLDTTNEEHLVAKSLAAQTEWAWASPNDSGTIGNDTSANNRSGFSALPGGFRLTSGNFRNIGTTGRWWCATEFDSIRAWRYNLRYDAGNLNRDNFLKGCGFSVRIVKD